MSCPNHGEDACCTDCTTAEDGLGFPHSFEAKGRKGLRECPDCLKWIVRERWTSDVDNGIFCCVDCMPAAYERIAKHLESILATATAPRRAKLQDAIEKVRKRARRMTLQP